jgi:hypothetical protein
MAEEKVTIELSRRAHDALVGLKREDENLDAFILRLATAARASGFFGQMRRDAQAGGQRK